jgi:hypothetical protein
MADRYDEDLRRDNEQRGGRDEGAGREQRADAVDETEAMERKLRRHGRTPSDDQVQENRNLSGSTTWETLPDQRDPHLQHARKGQAESPNDLTHEEQPKQRKPEGRG